MSTTPLLPQFAAPALPTRSFSPRLGSALAAQAQAGGAQAVAQGLGGLAEGFAAMERRRERDEAIRAQESARHFKLMADDAVNSFTATADSLLYDPEGGALNTQGNVAGLTESVMQRAEQAAVKARENLPDAAKFLFDQDVGTQLNTIRRQVMKHESQAIESHAQDVYSARAAREHSNMVANALSDIAVTMQSAATMREKIFEESRRRGMSEEELLGEIRAREGSAHVDVINALLGAGREDEAKQYYQLVRDATINGEKRQVISGEDRTAVLDAFEAHKEAREVDEAVWNIRSRFPGHSPESEIAARNFVLSNYRDEPEVGEKILDELKSSFADDREIAGRVRDRQKSAIAASLQRAFEGGEKPTWSEVRVRLASVLDDPEMYTFARDYHNKMMGRKVYESNEYEKAWLDGLQRGDLEGQDLNVLLDQFPGLNEHDTERLKAYHARDNATLTVNFTSGDAEFRRVAEAYGFLSGSGEVQPDHEADYLALQQRWANLTTLMASERDDKVVTDEVLSKVRDMMIAERYEEPGGPFSWLRGGARDSTSSYLEQRRAARAILESYGLNAADSRLLFGAMEQRRVPPQTVVAIVSTAHGAVQGIDEEILEDLSPDAVRGVMSMLVQAYTDQALGVVESVDQSDWWEEAQKILAGDTE